MSRTTWTPEQRSLVLAWLNIADGLADRWARQFPRIGRDEFIGVAYLALCQAALSFDPAGVRPFKYYAAIRIRGAFLDLLRAERGWSVDGRPLPNGRSPGRPPGRVELWWLFYGPEVAREDAAAVERARREAFEAHLGCLTGRQKEVLRGVFIEGLSFTAIGRRMGLSLSGASRLYHDALGVLRERAGEVGRVT